jgi:excisionase family DNA binding protein
MDGGDMLSMTEAAHLIGVTKSCIFQWYWRGKLHAVKVNGRLMTTPEEVHRAADLMAQNPTGRKRTGKRVAVTA